MSVRKGRSAQKFRGSKYTEPGRFELQKDGTVRRVSLTGDRPRGLLGALLARSEAERKMAELVVPPEVIKAVETLEDFLGGLPEGGDYGEA
jgi:hypothetical protein